MATWNSQCKFEKVDEPEVMHVRTDMQLICVSAKVMSQKYSSRVNDRGFVVPRQCCVVVICCGRGITLYVCILTISLIIHVAGRLCQQQLSRHFESAVICRMLTVVISVREDITCVCVVCMVCCKGRSCAIRGVL